MRQVITTTVTDRIHGISHDWHVTTVSVNVLRVKRLARLGRGLGEPRRLAFKRFAAAAGCRRASALPPAGLSMRPTGGESATWSGESASLRLAS